MKTYVVLLATTSALTPSKRARAPAPKVQKPPIGQPLDAAALAEENVRGRRYWHDPRIHNFGNVGFSGLFASFCAPIATAIIDLAAYQGRDVRKECAEAAAAAVNGPVTAVAEIGAGSGASTRALRAAFPGAAITAFDTSPHFLMVARWLTHWNPLRKERVTFTERNGEATGLPTASQDVVSIQFVLHEAPAQGRAALLAEARRVLKPGGLLAVVDIAREYEPSAAMASGEPYIYGYLRHVKRDLTAAGFAGVEERVVVEKRATLWLLTKDARPAVPAAARNNILKLPPPVAAPAGARNNILKLPVAAPEAAAARR